jgi:hypothetical protein
MRDSGLLLFLSLFSYPSHNTPPHMGLRKVWRQCYMRYATLPRSHEKVSTKTYTCQNASPFWVFCAFTYSLHQEILAVVFFSLSKIFSNEMPWYKLNGTYRLLFETDDVNRLSGRVHTIKSNTEALVVASKEFGLEANADKTKYMVM